MSEIKPSIFANCHLLKLDCYWPMETGRGRGGGGGGPVFFHNYISKS